MIGHFSEVWIALFAAFTVGSLLGWLLFRAIDRSDYAFDQRELSDALGRRLRVNRLPARPASPPREVALTGAGATPNKRAAASTEAAKTLRRRVQSSSGAAAWRAARDEKIANGHRAPQESALAQAKEKAESSAGSARAAADTPPAQPSAAEQTRSAPDGVSSRARPGSASPRGAEREEPSEEPWASTPGAWPPVNGPNWPTGQDGRSRPAGSTGHSQRPRAHSSHWTGRGPDQRDIWGQPEEEFTQPSTGAEAKNVPASPEIVAAASLLADGHDELSDSDRPPAFSPAPPNPDDLKKIRGIGPAFEKKLNELGIFRYAQIAAWTGAQQNWVGDIFSFAGRIERDRWTEQAARLAAAQRGDNGS